jgi:hypothetical protein
MLRLRMGRRWQKIWAWQDEIYSSSMPVLSNTSFDWMTASPVVLVQRAAEAVFTNRFGRDKPEESNAKESHEIYRDEAYGYERMILDVNDDIQIVIHNMNPAVPLDSLSFDTIAGWVIDNPSMRGRLQRKLDCLFDECDEVLLRRSS